MEGGLVKHWKQIVVFTDLINKAYGKLTFIGI